MSAIALKAVALLLIVLSAAWTATSAWAAEEPDLKLELVGLAPGNPREVQFKITNVSQWWADETTARFETVSPTAGNAQTGIFVENLDPGQSTIVTYTLAAPCDGHVVKGEVAAAKNYAGVAESNLANNRFNDPKPVCPKAQGIPEGAIDQNPLGITPDDLNAPLDLGIVPKPSRPLVFSGEMTISASQVLMASQRGGEDAALLQNFVAPRTIPDGKFGVGYWNEAAKNFLGDVNPSDVWQTRAVFDLSELKKLPGLDITHASLTYDEDVLMAGEGPPDVFTPVDKPTCVAGVYPALTAGLQNDLFTSGPASLVREPGGPLQPWDITPGVEFWLDDKPNFGVVFRGFSESHDFNNSRCLGAIYNIRIIVPYTAKT